MNPTALCPNPGVWRMVLIALQPSRMVLHLEPVREAAPCPLCGTLSARMHSRYRRRAWDLPWSRWPVQLVVYARRFFCDDPGCQRRIFTETFPQVLAPYARHTERLRMVLLELAHASGAEMAARVTKLLGCAISPDTLIRRQRTEQFPIPSPRVLGVDEFALRRGSTYASLLVDLERHRPVDVVEDRKAAPVARWLAAHPGTEVLARDRAEAYALAGRTAAPHALQVADRFHLVRNVGDALKGLLRSRRWVLTNPGLGPGNPPPALPAPSPKASEEGRVKEVRPTPTKQANWETVRQRRDKGQSVLAIARELGMNRKTVRRYLTLNHPPIYGPRRPRPTRATPYFAYLRQRWAEGCHNARSLYQELLQRGYSGAERQVRAAVRPWRSAPGPPSPTRPLPLHWLALCPSRRLTTPQREELELILGANPLLALGYQFKERFHQLVAHRDVAELDRWLEEAAQCQLPTFKALARTFRRDYEAVRAALTTPWSTAQCEGQNTRVKLIKRLGYGRAKLDLLRQRILHRPMVC